MPGLSDLSLRFKGLIIVAIPILAVLASVLALQELTRQQARRAEELRKPVEEMQLTVGRLRAGLADLHEDMLTYAVSGDREALHESIEARRELQSALGDLRSLQRDEPDRVAAIEAQVEAVAADLAALPDNSDLADRADRRAARIEGELGQWQLDEEQRLANALAREEALQDRWRVGIVLATILAIAGGGLLTAWIFTRSIVSRVERLQENAGRLTRDEPPLPVASGRDEIGLLGEKLEKAANLMSQRHRELRDTRAFLEHLIASSPVVTYRVDPTDFSLSYISPNVERLLGYTVQEVLDKPYFWIQQIHADDRERFLLSVSRSWETTLPEVNYEHRFLTKDGTYSWLYGVMRMERDDDGTPVGLLGYAHDITQRIEAEQALRLSEERFRMAKEEAEAANRAKSEFLSRMSHELRTPLNAILGFAQILEMDGGTGQESIEHIVKAGNHLLDLINEVLDISRIETGRMSVSLEPVEVDSVIRESLDIVGQLAVDANIRIEWDREPGHHVLADRQRLKQVMINLLTNAVKYNRPNGLVTVASTEIGGRVRLQVKDTGSGIPPDKVAALFTPFDRLGAEHSGVEGTGLGLALSKRLLEAMGGNIDVESKLGEGSAFTIELPATQRVFQPREPAEVEREPAAAPVTRAAATVLYVEDNPSNLELVKLILARRKELELLTAADGTSGLALTKERLPDLVLLDLNLPDMSGRDVLTALKADPATKDIPVVIVSADATKHQVERLLNAGASAYMTKPLNVKQFFSVIDSNLAGEEQLAHAP